jgi:hypothetical protein
MHELCFDCLVKYVETKELKTCITCTNPITGFLINRLNRTEGILQEFIDYIPIISRITKTNLEHSSLVTSKDLEFYCKNNVELKIAKLSIDNHICDIDEIIPLINWKRDQSVIRDIGMPLLESVVGNNQSGGATYYNYQRMIQSVIPIINEFQ